MKICARTGLNLTHKATWSICCAGQNLPLGKVDSVAERLVTFN